MDPNLQNQTSFQEGSPLTQMPPSPPPVEPSGSSGLLKKLIIGLGILLVITAIGTGGYLLGIKKTNAPAVSIQ